MPKYKLTRDLIHQGELVLINPDNLLVDIPKKSTLEPFSREYKDILFSKKANQILKNILKDIKATDKIVPVSGFRTKEDQESIYYNSIAENGLEFTQKYVALPNASEHQTGLAIDLGEKKDDIDFIRPSFPRTGICEEFRQKAIQYGFIERYQKEKEIITHISAEEWHFRYVGHPHSKIMADKNLCLEEYIDYLRNKDIIYDEYEITYIPYSNKEIELELSDYDTISGNNIDGFIVTRRKIWKNKQNLAWTIYG